MHLQRVSVRLGEWRLLHALCDCTLLAGVALAVGKRSEPPYPAASVLASAAALVGLWLFFAGVLDAYHIGVLRHPFRTAYVACLVHLATSCAFVLFARFTGGFLPILRPRISEIGIVLLAIVPIAATRALGARLLTHETLRRRVAVIGSGTARAEMVTALEEWGGGAFELVACIASGDPGTTGEDLAAFGTTGGNLVATVEGLGIDQLVLANPAQAPELLRELSICHERGVQITPMFALYQDLTGRIPIGHLGADWFVALTGRSDGRWRAYATVKRAADLTLALLALMLLIPLFPVVALAIRLDSPGPIFFRQIRLGRAGRRFAIVKFRSMRQDAEDDSGARWATGNDARVTRVGRLLRRTHLDELPQFWNVAMGDMALVGPRPERPEFEHLLEREVPFFRARRAVRPGMTGWAQVHAGYGNSVEDVRRKVEYDLYYVKHQSLYLDLLILVRTIAVIARLGGT
jgi:exopolysaccharide biosynthesis polyprenyl glycosylphosphotransferase